MADFFKISPTLGFGFSMLEGEGEEGAAAAMVQRKEGGCTVHMKRRWS
jgi:hypothetical protein